MTPSDAVVIAIVAIVLTLHWIAIVRLARMARKWEAAAREWRRIADSRMEPVP